MSAPEIVTTTDPAAANACKGVGVETDEFTGASFTDTEQLGAHIKAFQEAYNETAHPFVWKKREIRGAQLSNSIKNFCN